MVFVELLDDITPLSSPPELPPRVYPKPCQKEVDPFVSVDLITIDNNKNTPPIQKRSLPPIPEFRISVPIEHEEIPLERAKTRTTARKVFSCCFTATKCTVWCLQFGILLFLLFFVVGFAIPAVGQFGVKLSEIIVG